ncbi:MAG: hypothetical protein V1794_07460 [Candidatus Glassbacteria bacterium]
MRNVFSPLLAGLLVVAGVALPAFSQKTSNPVQAYGFASLVSVAGSVNFEDGGNKIGLDGNLLIDFALRNAPKVQFVREGGDKGYFKFNAPMPKGASAAKIVFVTTEGCTDCEARVPEFKAVWQGYKGSRNDFVFGSFKDYSGPYEFRFAMEFSGTLMNGRLNLLNLDWFNDGAEHHLVGDLKLFGVQFKSAPNEELVFKIDGDKYSFVRGAGTAITPQGETIQFGN